MRRWLVGAVAIGLTCSIWLIVRADEPEWTSRSPQALGELDRGLEDLARFYHRDAMVHFKAALALDPELVPARLMVLGEEKDDARRKEALRALLATDRSRLNDRERYLLARAEAIDAGRVDDAAKLALSYHAEHPEDTWAIRDRAADAFEAKDYRQSEELFRHLVDVDPNRVEAHNMLGYTSMALGEFQEAEDRFRTYRFIAADQANPHDSLGELFTLLGRSAEAREELEAALALKPDFCASYLHLLDVEISAGGMEPEAVAALAARADGQGCSTEAASIRCRGSMWNAFWRGSCADPDQACKGAPRDAGLLRHRCLVRQGRTDEAVAREQELLATSAKEARRHPKALEIVKALVHHMEAVRAAAGGDQDQAMLLFEEADEESYYWGDGHGFFKLFNLLTLAGALEERGDAEGSARLLEKVRGVNPAMAAAYESHRGAFSLGEIAPLE